ncbi:hypothetical protein [Massilia sp. BSC265]|uniref:hypothetical protein n=1 Tax=Massilia sp. BSC265 TaxID=1549812 RepID=UPI0004E96D0D|nr:hypothetical protein [Massilia sp. BSC265]KFI08037.1 hypothetical protein JN27_06255 [Massilia sp. BSC265]
MRTGEILFRLGGAIIGICVALAGVSVMLSSQSLMSMCRPRECGLNAVFSLLGEDAGKLAYGGGIGAFGLCFLFTALRPNRAGRDANGDAAD